MDFSVALIPKNFFYIDIDILMLKNFDNDIDHIKLIKLNFMLISIVLIFDILITYRNLVIELIMHSIQGKTVFKILSNLLLINFHYNAVIYMLVIATTRKRTFHAKKMPADHCSCEFVKFDSNRFQYIYALL